MANNVNENLNASEGESSGQPSGQSPNQLPNQSQEVPMELASWLESLGTPSSITNLMPADLRSIDIGAFMRMLGGVGIETSSSHSNDPINSSLERQHIQWLPISRS
jgi:hypothetical protein